MSETGSNDVAATGEAPVKTAKQLEKEAKKAAKLAKLQEKLDKKAATEAVPPKEVNILIKCVNGFKWFLGCNNFFIFHTSIRIRRKR